MRTELIHRRTVLARPSALAAALVMMILAAALLGNGHAAAQTNSPATGAPIITGTAELGETLTVDTSGIADEDGMDNAQLSLNLYGGYNGQGGRLLGTGGCDPGCTKTFEVNVNAVGTAITVAVSFTDDAGNYEEVVSEPTARVPGPLTDVTMVDTSGQSEIASFGLSTGSDRSLAAKVRLDDPTSGTYSFRVNLAEDADVDSVVWNLTGYDAEWVSIESVKRTDGTAPFSLYGEGRNGNLLGEGLPFGYYLLDATAYSGNGEPLQYLSVSFLVAPVNSPVTGLPTTSGRTQVGQTVAIDMSTIDDADGLENVVYNYQWHADGAAIDGATSSAYTIQPSDLGKTIKVVVTFTDDLGNPAHITTTFAPSVYELLVTGAAAVDYAENGTSAVAAYTAHGSTDPITWSLTGDDGGEFLISSAGTLTFSSSPDYENPSDTDADNVYEVTVNASDSTLSGTLDVTVTVTDAAEINSPATGAPVISGAARVGEALTADTSGIADADGTGNAVFNYQWLADRDTEVQTGTGPVYVPSASDVDKTISVRVSFTDDAGNSESLVSDETGVVAPASTAGRDAPVAGTYVTVEITSGDDTVSWHDRGECSTGYNLYLVAVPKGFGATTRTHLGTAAAGSTEATLPISYSWGGDQLGAPKVSLELYCGDRSRFVASTRLPIHQKALKEGTYSSEPLTGLTIDPGTLSPSFTRGLGHYTAEASDGVITITPTAVTGYVVDFIRNPGPGTGVGCNGHGCAYSYGDGVATGVILADADGDTEGFQVNLEPGENRLALGVHTGDVSTGLARVYRLTVTAQDPPVTPLTAELQGVPDSHSGSGTFTFRILFSEDVSTGFAALKEHAFEVTNATIRKAQRVGGRDDLRKFTVQPSSGTAVILVLPATGDCNSAGAICTDGGKRLSTRLEVVVPGPANTPATGAPAIDGTLEVGQVLTASTTNIDDADGMDDAVFGHQWTADSADIDGATAPTYTLTDSDVGKAIRVRVSFTDDRGHQETLTSSPTAAVLAPPTPNNPATGTAVVNGTVQVGETLTVDVSGITDLDGMESARFVYNWFVGYIDENSPAVLRAMAAVNTYTIEPRDEDKRLTVIWSFTDDGGNRESGTVTTAQVAPAPNSPATGAPEIYGVAQVGETLTVDVSGISDRDGTDDAVFSYQWLTDGDAIAGATDSVYTLTDNEEGRTISVRVSFVDDAGHDEVLTSAATAAVLSSNQEVERPASEPTDRPHDLRAVAQAGVVVLTWNAPDDGSAATYRILRHRPEEGEPDPLVYVDYTLDRATRYVDTEVEPGTLYTYSVKAADFFGLLGPSSDPASVRVPESNTPATGAPVIDGTPQVGETLSADTSGISDGDGTDGAVFNYQWLSSRDAEIPGATDSAYTLVDADEGKAIKVRVSFVDDAGNDEALTSLATAPVAAAPPQNAPATGAPGINGAVKVGHVLTVDITAISDQDGTDDADFTYQWLADDAPIVGATGDTYLLTSSEKDRAITVTVSFTDDQGNAESVTSAATAVTADPLTASVENEPDTHNGQSDFTFEIRFSEQFGLSYATLKNHALTVVGGGVQSVSRLEPDSITRNVRWEVAVRPDGNGDVTITLPETTDCDSQGAICTSDRRQLSNRNELTVSGPGG